MPVILSYAAWRRRLRFSKSRGILKQLSQKSLNFRRQKAVLPLFPRFIAPVCGFFGLKAAAAAVSGRRFSGPGHECRPPPAGRRPRFKA